jgi:hypothetical protein
MKRVQIGTVLYENEDTSAIYEKYKEFFEIDNKREWSIKYIISKEPSQALVSEIEAYYALRKERSKKHDEFVDTVANEVLANLSPEDKAQIFRQPDSITYHFTTGLWIRNHYIRGKELDFDFIADNLSSEIMSRVASLIIDNYDYENPFYRHLYDNPIFNHMRKLFFALKGMYPDEIMAKYADLPDDVKAAETAAEELRSTLLNANRLEQLGAKYGLADAQRCEYKSIVDAHNKKDWHMVPYDIALLTSKTLEPEVRQKLLSLLDVVLNETPEMAVTLPAFIFNQKDAVLLAVGARGKSLKRFPKFNSDDEIIRAAISQDGEAIQYVNKELRETRDYIVLALSNEYSSALKARCMIPYRDDAELVKIALEANGCNIQYASDRLRDDFEIAKFAVCHQKNRYTHSTICNLSTRLRDSLEIALLDIREGNASVDQYSVRLRDNDEIAEALLASDSKWKLYQMSKRIQKKYEGRD